jgi:hypothetical protein
MGIFSTTASQNKAQNPLIAEMVPGTAERGSWGRSVPRTAPAAKSASAHHPRKLFLVYPGGEGSKQRARAT